VDLDAARHALITGGASGIGLALAEALAARGIGVTIVDANRDTLGAVLATGRPNFRGYQLDVRDRESWARVKTEAEAAGGPVDILVNNAGVAPSGYEISEMESAHFDQIIAINLIGVFNGVSAFAADLRRRGRGHIVNTASMAGITAMAYAGGYVASKFGVVGFSETLREELAPHGVGVSVFCPGQVSTPLMKNTVALGGRTRFPADFVSGGESPADVAPLVLRGIAENAPYILSDPDAWRERVEQRLLALRAAFDGARKN
jgi:NAD(P)-dependent dehydrogenase (short-subunit alcohol dehydrogenase family)